MSIRTSQFRGSKKSQCRSTLGGRPIGRTVSLTFFLHCHQAGNTPCTTEDSHLRSTWDLQGYEVWATDGEIGRVEGFIMDDASWHLGYLDVKAGDWLHSRSVLVPTRWVDSISWADHRVNVHHTREKV